MPNIIPFNELPEQRKFLKMLMKMAPAKKRNPYYVTGIIGLVVNLLLYFVLSYTVDPYFGSIVIFFIPVWIMVLVVGYRKEHPRR